MSRIVIEDLPALELLTEDQLAEIFGAGRKYRSLGFQTLEDRKMCTANALVSVAANVQQAASNVNYWTDYAVTVAAEHGQISRAEVNSIGTDLNQMNNAVQGLGATAAEGQLNTSGLYASQAENAGHALFNELNAVAPIPRNSALESSMIQMAQSLQTFYNTSASELQQLQLQHTQQSPGTTYNYLGAAGVNLPASFPSGALTQQQLSAIMNVLPPGTSQSLVTSAFSAAQKTGGQSAASGSSEINALNSLYLNSWQTAYNSNASQISSWYDSNMMSAAGASSSANDASYGIMPSYDS